MKYPSKVKQNDEKQLIRWAPTVNTQEQNTWNSLFSLGVQLGYYVLALHVCWDIILTLVLRATFLVELHRG